jgi:hypothetical protein
MNPLVKAIGAVIVLAAGTLGASLEDSPLEGLPFRPASADGGDDGSGNETGNETADGNQTADGNETAEGNETADNETAPDGNRTADGNETADNETASDEDGAAEEEPAESEAAPRSAVCSYDLDEYGNDLTPSHHEWEWFVTKDVQHLSVSFSGYGGIPMSLGDHPDVRLVDGSGRTLAHSDGDGYLQLTLERGVDYLADGMWRLVFDSSDAFSDYYAQVGLDCTAAQHDDGGDGAADDEDAADDEGDEDDEDDG